MTPLALALAHYFLRNGQREDYDSLCQCQFFECSGISSAAKAAGISQANDAIIPARYWPADNIWLEFTLKSLLPGGDDGGHHRLRGARIGVNFVRDYETKDAFRNLYIRYAMIDGLLKHYITARWTPEIREFIVSGERPPSIDSDEYQANVLYFNIAVAAMQIITTPRLVLMREHIAKPRRVKGCGRMIPGVSWNTVTIDPQATISPRRAEANGPSMPLHFVHGYHKPSLGKFIEGHWRGSAELGIRLHTYEVKGA